MSPELQGVVIGGLIGFLTAALGHVFGWLQLRSKRAFDLRQTVYLEAAAALANSLRFFDKVTELNIEDARLSDDIHPVNVAMFKIHVVGSPATIAALSAANQYLVSVALDLTKKRGRLKAAREQASDESASDSESDIDRLYRGLLVDAMRAGMIYQRHLVEMNLSVRKELSLPLDAAHYVEATRRAEAMVTTAIEQQLGGDPER